MAHASAPLIGNASGVVTGADGSRLYGMDAELFLKREAQRDHELERRIAGWLEKAVGEPLADPNDLWISLKSGVVLCQAVNAITAPDAAIKKYAKTNLLPLMEMDNIQLYLKACWNIGIPSGDFFIVSDLYQKKSMPQVVQNLVSLTRVAAGLGYAGEPLVPTNTNKDRVKAWEPVASGGALQHVDDMLEKNSPAERITQLVVDLGQTKHRLDEAKADNHQLQATMRAMKDEHRAEKDEWMRQKTSLENRLKKFEPIDTGEEGEPGSMALKAMELHYSREMAALKAELDAEREKYFALEKKHDELKVRVFLKYLFGASSVVVLYFFLCCRASTRRLQPSCPRSSLTLSKAGVARHPRPSPPSLRGCPSCPAARAPRRAVPRAMHPSWSSRHPEAMQSTCRAMRRVPTIACP